MKTFPPQSEHLGQGLSVHLLDEGTTGAWNDYLDQQESGILYHRLQWDQALAVYNLRTTRLTAVRDGCVVGVLPLVYQKSLLFGKRLVSVPWFDAAGILASDNATQNVLLAEALEQARQMHADVLHLRQSKAVEDWPAPRTDKVCMRLSLEPDAELLWQRLSPKVRNQVRKAEKSGLSCDAGNATLLRDFYAIYSANMRDLGSPCHSFKFFQAVMEGFDQDVRLHVVRHGNEPVGAGLTMHNGHCLEIPWASSLRRFNPYCVNHLLYWSILRMACQKGYTTFCFGRSTRGSGQYRFKKQWGAVAEPLCWYSFDRQGETILEQPEQSFGLSRRIWQHLPLPLTRVLGPHVVRRVA